MKEICHQKDIREVNSKKEESHPVQSKGACEENEMQQKSFIRMVNQCEKGQWPLKKGNLWTMKSKDQEGIVRPKSRQFVWCLLKV